MYRQYPFWSVDRQDFIEAGQLLQGEQVLLYSGETKRVVQKLPRPGPQVVYNLEVYAEHVYHVTQDGVLVHNSCHKNSKTSLAKNHGYVIFDKTTGDVYKYGISSAKIGKDGLSRRVRQQVSKLNKNGGNYEGIVLRHFNNRREALNWEDEIVGIYHALKHQLPGNIRPKGHHPFSK